MSPRRLGLRSGTDSPGSASRQQPASQYRVRRTRSTQSRRSSSFEVAAQTSIQPITFGIEIEAVIAFHESKLQHVLDTYYDSISIQKHFPPPAHQTFLDAHGSFSETHSLYPSWVLQVPDEHMTDRSLALMLAQTHTIIGQNAKLRPYLAEPMIIAKEILAASQLPVEVRAQMLPRSNNHPDNGDTSLGPTGLAMSINLRSQRPNYSQWTLTGDESLIGLLESQLRDMIGDAPSPNDPSPNSNHGQERTWDSAGLELISPIFKFAEKQTAFATITRYLTALHDDTLCRILTSKWAGLHVHIGLDYDGSGEAPLLLLQHLAYILICHEDLISSLHPRSRCGLPAVAARLIEDSYEADVPSDQESDSPRSWTSSEIAAENERRVLEAEATHTSFQDIMSNRRYFLHSFGRDIAEAPPRLATIRISIFNPDLTVPELIAMLQKPSSNHDLGPLNRHRGYMYNFNNLAAMFMGSTWKTPKPTIEFRQHACSTDPVEIRRWVEFYYALVKLAQRMTESTTRWGSDESVDDSNERSPSVSPNRRSNVTQVSTPAQRAFADREGRKYPSSRQGTWPCDSIARFCGPEFLGLDEEAVQFWHDRYEKFKDDRPQSDEIDQSAASQRKEFGW